MCWCPRLDMWCHLGEILSQGQFWITPTHHRRIQYSDTCDQCDQNFIHSECRAVVNIKWWSSRAYYYINMFQKMYSMYYPADSVWNLIVTQALLEKLIYSHICMKILVEKYQALCIQESTSSLIPSLLDKHLVSVIA